MPLRCPQIELTWYPGDYPSTDSPLVLLDDAHRVEEPSPLAGSTTSEFQPANYIRGLTPDFFERGNGTSELEFEEVREIADPAVAQETALAILAGKPTMPGWLKIVVTGRETTWKVVPCAIRSVTYRPIVRDGQLRLRWVLLCGLVSVLVEGEDGVTIWPDGEVIAGPGTVNRGALLLGPNRTYPVEE